MFKRIFLLTVLFASLIININSYAKVEPSKSASQRVAYTYRVFGKKYYVMSSSKDYQKVGIASWYGGSFHGRNTSSGERYNMYGMTAAHKTLPLSTYVLVTNVKTGKKVIVKINDRGPFVGNRIIDLSYGAAKKLGIVHQGIASVTVKAIYQA